MAKSKDDIKYGTAQAKLSEDESLRVAYKAGTPLESGKIAESEPITLSPDLSHQNQNKNPTKPNSDPAQSADEESKPTG